MRKVTNFLEKFKRGPFVIKQPIPVSLDQELLHTLIAITRHKNKLSNKIKIHFKDGVRVCAGTRVQKSSENERN